ncbi:MAG: nucleoside triphosphate pyrophosphohydrolase [Alphaproteobacteria bacterium]|nr:nucleoside triphosphate pyrophosphohydrolase [Alphaproteobacteria bacterium]
MSAIDRLLDLMARLRDPEIGCTWDRAQSFATIAPYTIEEAYEVADAIRRGDLDALKDELGDLLFQVVFHARMAEEEGRFAFDDVAQAIIDKMIRRHPHLFSPAGGERPSWEAIKAAERQAKGGTTSALDGVAATLPALTRAVKLQDRAARVGFDWPEALQVLDKLEEEIAELRAEILAGERDKARAELGDLLFACANLARHLDALPEDMLAAANAKFERRFHAIEAALARQGRHAKDATLDELEALWRAAKRQVG